MPNVFITGTDTGVGKTIVSALLAGHLALSGKRVCVFKPVQTGADNLVQPDDPFQIRHWLAVTPPEIPPITVDWQFVYALPAAPWVAARVAETTDPNASLSPEGPLSIEAIVSRVQALNAKFDWVVIEGAGGVCVPLTESTDMLDLMQALHKEFTSPAVVVTRPNLGTINHTCLTVGALESRGIPIQGVVVSGFGKEVRQTDPSAGYLPQVFKKRLPSDLSLHYLDVLSMNNLIGLRGSFWELLRQDQGLRSKLELLVSNRVTSVQAEHKKPGACA